MMDGSAMRSSPADQAIDTGSPLILVVDDSPDDCNLASSLLIEHLDARVVVVHNGLQALDEISRSSPALVLTDMQMPELDGLGLVQAVRANYPNLPIILMTSNGSEELAMRALEAGAASYVPKRLLAKELINTVENVIGTTRLERRRYRILECITNYDCQLELENDPSLVPHLVAFIQEKMLRMRLCSENGKIRVGVALEEALLNGIYHGNLELSSHLREEGSNLFHELAAKRRYLEPYCSRRLHVGIFLTPADATIRIRDEGPGFDLSKLSDPTDPENLLLASGRGLLLIRTFMDSVVHNESGNEITMTRKAG